MPSQRLYAEIAIDEGSRLGLDSSDKYSLVGCLVVFGGMRKRLEAAFAKRRPPKWRDATPDDVEYVLHHFEELEVHAKVNVLEKNQESAELLKSKLEKFFVQAQAKVEAAAQRLGREPRPMPSMDGYFHLLAFASVQSIIARAAIKETQAQSIRRSEVGTVEVSSTVYVDGYDARDGEHQILEGAIRRFGLSSKITDNVGVHPKIRFDIKDVLFPPERERASLLMVDYVCGIVAAHVLPKHKPRTQLVGAPFDRWHERVKANDRVLVTSEAIDRFLSAIE